MIAAATVCGRIAPAPLGSRLDRQFLERMRDSTGAGLIGAGTVRDADPELRGSGGVMPESRIRAIVSMSGEMPFAERKIFSSAPYPIIFTASNKVDDVKKNVVPYCTVIGLPAGPAGLSMRAALQVLAELGVQSLLVEGGGMLNYACLCEGIVDEIMLTVVPRVSGKRGAASLAAGPAGLGLDAPFFNLELVGVRPAQTGEIFCHYKVIRKR